MQPLPNRGRQTFWQPPQLKALRHALDKKTDATLDELAQSLEAMVGRRLVASTIWRGLQRLNVTRKKKDLHATERDRPEVQAQRVIWRVGLIDIDVTDLIFFDECGINLSMTPTHAWSAKGERAPGSAPKNWGDNVTVAAGLNLREGIVAPLQLAGSMDGPHFEAYLEQFLLPQMRPGQFLVVDNLGAHKTVAAQEACRKAGVWLVFLPPYSPDLNPIEKAWSKLKALLRKAGARTHGALDEALVKALRAISPSDALGWFRAAGIAA